MMVRWGLIHQSDMLEGGYIYLQVPSGKHLHTELEHHHAIQG